MVLETTGLPETAVPGLAGVRATGDDFGGSWMDLPSDSSGCSDALFGSSSISCLFSPSTLPLLLHLLTAVLHFLLLVFPNALAPFSFLQTLVEVPLSLLFAF